MGALAVLETLDRDGSVRHSSVVHAWPLRVGRALDNDIVLDDPHTAAHHFSVDTDENGVFVLVGESVNGLRCGNWHMAAGERREVGEHPFAFVAGRTHFRLRLPYHALPAEQALRATRSLASGLGTLAVLGALALAALVFGTYLDTDPEEFVRTLGSVTVAMLGGLLVWCGGWTLLSKIFARQAHFGWHLRVALTAMLAWEAVNAGSSLLAFALSWPWIADFSFVAGYAIGGALLYFHLQAVDTHRPHRMRAFAVTSALSAIALNLWFNWQNGDRLGAELYMNHLFPPALRVAAPVDTATFIQRAAPLQARLDEKAKKKESGGDDALDEE